MNTYSFRTTWQIPAPIDRVWAVIADYDAWPSWWRAVDRVRRISPGDAARIGEVNEFVFRAPLGYRLRFRMKVTHIAAPHELDGRSSGDLSGIGRWRLTANGDATTVRYQWDVRSTRRWMNLLAPIARPIFTWSHDHVMESGRTGLLRRMALVSPPATGDRSAAG
jgi:hypothetical protein